MPSTVLTEQSAVINNHKQEGLPSALIKPRSSFFSLSSLLTRGEVASAPCWAINSISFPFTDPTAVLFDPSHINYPVITQKAEDWMSKQSAKRLTSQSTSSKKILCAKTATLYEETGGPA